MLLKHVVDGPRHWPRALSSRSLADNERKFHKFFISIKHQGHITAHRAIVVSYCTVCTVILRGVPWQACVVSSTILCTHVSNPSSLLYYPWLDLACELLCNKGGRKHQPLELPCFLCLWVWHYLPWSSVWANFTILEYALNHLQKSPSLVHVSSTIASSMYVQVWLALQIGMYETFWCNTFTTHFDHTRPFIYL